MAVYLSMLRCTGVCISTYYGDCTLSFINLLVRVYHFNIGLLCYSDITSFSSCSPPMEMKMLQTCLKQESLPLPYHPRPTPPIHVIHIKEVCLSVLPANTVAIKTKCSSSIWSQTVLLLGRWQIWFCLLRKDPDASRETAGCPVY